MIERSSMRHLLMVAYAMQAVFSALLQRNEEATHYEAAIETSALDGLAPLLHRFKREWGTVVDKRQKNRAMDDSSVRFCCHWRLCPGTMQPIS